MLRSFNIKIPAMTIVEGRWEEYGKEEGGLLRLCSSSLAAIQITAEAPVLWAGGTNQAQINPIFFATSHDGCPSPFDM